MLPSLGRKNPLIKLKTVVLPAPFGPMMKRISPSFIANETFFTATSPPKRLVTFCSSRIGVTGQLRRAPYAGWIPLEAWPVYETGVAGHRRCLPAGRARPRQSGFHKSADDFP